MMGQEIPKVRPRSFDEIEMLAEVVLRQMQPDRLRTPGATDVMSLFCRLREFVPGAEYYVSDQLGPGVEGMVQPDGSVEVSAETYNGVLAGVPRSRWTMAHEIGHARLHLGQIRKSFTDGRGIQLFRKNDLKPYENPEVQAHQFAAALLMPDSMVAEALRNIHVALWADRLMYVFEVSREAAERRIAYLKKLSMLK